jgi:adenylosuccinate lyase
MIQQVLYIKVLALQHRDIVCLAITHGCLLTTTTYLKSQTLR